MVNKFKLTPKTDTAKETIARTLAIANDYAGELTIEVLSLDKIELDPENNRELSLTLHDAIHGIDSSDPQYNEKKQDWKSLESLAKTIVDDQLINPIFVYRFGNKCRLIAGERRTLASAIAGKKEIIARIASQRPVGSKLRVLQWIENNERVDLSLAERIANLEAILKEYRHENKIQKEKTTAKTLSELTGMSMTQSRRYLLILDASPEIKQTITEGKIENIKLIELILSVQNFEQQQVLLNAAMANASFDAIVKLKNELESGKNKKPEIKSRKQTNINLGHVKPTVAKVIFEALASSKNFKSETVQQFVAISKNTQWNNHKSVENLFKKTILLIAQDA